MVSCGVYVVLYFGWWVGGWVRWWVTGRRDTASKGPNRLPCAEPRETQLTAPDTGEPNPKKGPGRANTSGSVDSPGLNCHPEIRTPPKSKKKLKTKLSWVKHLGEVESFAGGK